MRKKISIIGAGIFVISMSFLCIVSISTQFMDQMVSMYVYNSIDLFFEKADPEQIRTAYEILEQKGYRSITFKYIFHNILTNPFFILFILAAIVSFLFLFLINIYQINKDKKDFDLLCEELVDPTQRKISKQANDILNQVNKIRSFYETKISEIHRQYDNKRVRQEDLAHQIKSSLSAAMLSADMIDNDISCAKIQSQLIIEQLERSNHMLNMFLLENKVFSNDKNINFMNASIQNCIKNSIQNVKKYADEKDIDIILGDSDCILFMDMFWIEEGIETILKNAITYSDVHSTIHIKVYCDDYLHILIQNQGKLNLNTEEIFTRYASSDLKNEHYGIGLNMVKNIIEKHFGKIYVENDEGYVNFHIKIPTTKLERFEL